MLRAWFAALLLVCASNAAFANNGTPSQNSQSATAVNVQSPIDGSTTSTSVPVQANAYVSGQNITAMTLNVDSVNMYTVFQNSVNTTLNLSPGWHTLFVKAWDAQGHYYDQVLHINASSAGNANYSSQHVFVLMLENRSDAAAMHYMPYLNWMATQYSVGTEMYSATHGSWSAYGEITAGIAPFNGTSLGGACNGAGCGAPQNIPNLVRQFARDGKSWKGYFQSLPYWGFMGYTYGDYAEKHNPFPYFSDVAYSGAQQQNMVDDGQLINDLNAGTSPNYSLIVPDLTHDGHDPGDSDAIALSNADNYLAGVLPTLFASRYFQPGGDGVLIVTFDESDLYNDNSCGTNPDPYNCGGHVFLAVMGPRVNRGFQSPIVHRQADVLRTTCDLLGLSACPGDGAQGAGMSEFFGPSGCSALGGAGVHVCAPAGGQWFQSAIHVNASGTGANGAVNRLELWIDGHKINNYFSWQMDAMVPLAPGSHVATVVEVDTSGAYIKSSPITVNVY